MELIVKHFSQLRPEELWELYKLRVAVFVVEQKCPYQEVDDADKDAYHLFLKDDDGIEAYARVLPPGTAFSDAAAIGRVIAKKRRCGLGGQILNAAIQTAREQFSPSSIKLAAQLYARTLYEKAGFVPVSEPFLEDGIPHILMELAL